MELYRPAGIHSAVLRCYRIGYNPNALHFESASQFGSVADIRNVIRYNDAAKGPKPILFMHAEHAPRELQLDVIFKRFCLMIGITDHLLEAQISAYNPLPSIAGDVSASWSVSSGFPVTAPTNNIDHTRTYSFGHEELSAFLGSFTQFANKMVIVNLRSQFTNMLTTAELARTINMLAQKLAPRSFPDRILH